MIFTSFESQNTRKCPKCNGVEVCRSQRIDLFERTISLLNVYPYRCKQHTCNHRFQSFGRH